MATQEDLEDDPLDGGASDEEILAVSDKRFKLAEEAEIQMRIDELDDKRFFAGEQWEPQIKAQRIAKQRPILTINRLPQQVRQVTNDQRQNRPAIQVNPVDDKATVETAKVNQGIIRHIEYNSNADLAYDTAFESAAICGRGFWRVLTDYCDPMSFDQEIKIMMIPNHFMAYLDPTAIQPDGSDANWGFVFEDISLEDYQAEYPEADISKGGESVFDSVEAKMPGWARNKTVRVAEYFYKTFKPANICLMSDGSVVLEKDLPAALAQGLKCTKKRKTTLPAIKWVKRDGCQILDKKDWAGSWVPVVQVIGQRSDIDGKKIIEGIVRNAKDPQRVYNYMKSAMIETIALAPKAPYIVAEGQIEGHEDAWGSANIENHSVLQYKMVDLGGHAAPPPQRNVYEPPIQAMSTVMNESGEDIKATTGIYDPTLGNGPREQSGVAMSRQNQQSQTSNFHLVDNLSRSIRHTGRICLELIPVVYDVPAQQRILGDDGVPKMVPINQPYTENGQEKSHMLGAGKYDCTVSTGPSYQTKRQEAAASMINLTKTYPKIMDVAGDLMVSQMDWPLSKEVGERLKKTLPPGLADSDEQNQQQPLPPQVQQRMQQMGQMIEQLTQHLDQKTKQIETKSLELESKERIAAMQVKAELELGLAKLQAASATTMLGHEIDRISARQSALGDGSPIENEIDPTAGQIPGAQADPNEQQPTGGQPPGNQSMGV